MSKISILETIINTILFSFLIIIEDFKGINHSNKRFWPQRQQAMNMMVEEYGHLPLKFTKILIET